MDEDFVMLQEENARLKLALVDARNSNASLRDQIKPIKELEAKAYAARKDADHAWACFNAVAIFAMGCAALGAIACLLGWF